MRICYAILVTIITLLITSGCCTNNEDVSKNLLFSISAQAYPAEIWCSYYNNQKNKGNQTFQALSNPAIDISCQFILSLSENDRLTPVFDKWISSDSTTFFILQEKERQKIYNGIAYKYKCFISSTKNFKIEKIKNGRIFQNSYLIAIAYTSGCRDIETNTFNEYRLVDISYFISTENNISDVKICIKKVESHEIDAVLK